VTKLINRDARILICGLISEYNATEPPRGPNMRPILVNRATVRGFIVSDHADRFGDFIRDASGWVQAGRLRYREDIVEGLENAPRAFIGLLRGENFGKRLIRVSPDPTRK
jgi:NADPH-dependent curcumin reductase CurA